MKQFVKAALAHTPYRIVRARGANRFEAIESCLQHLREHGYAPKIVIDGGAHIGSFSLATKGLFSSATHHLIEPQPACFAQLDALCAREGFHLHKCALGSEVGELRMAAGDEPSTGAHISDADTGTAVIAASTLDALFAGSVAASDRALLKLDLQGYEMHALSGAREVLPRIEVILSEVSFFQQAYEPKIADLVSFLAAKNFILYDIAALSGRTRDNRLKQGDFVFVRSDSPLMADDRWA